jgi:hypothetical protein
MVFYLHTNKVSNHKQLSGVYSFRSLGLCKKYGLNFSRAKTKK